MNRQQPLALAPPAGDADWSERSLLDGPTRRALVSINLAFLDLAGRARGRRAAQADPGLAAARDRFADRTRGGPEALRAIAVRALRPALRRRCILVGGDRGGRRRAGRDDASQRWTSGSSAFTRAAIMVAWHLAQTRASGARLVFGASPATVAAIAAMPVAAVERLARRVAAALSARFGSRARFWLQFEGCAARPDERSVDLLRQLGLADPGRGERPRPVPAATPAPERRVR